MAKLKAIKAEIKRQRMAAKILKAGAKSKGQKQFTGAAFNRALARRTKQK